MDLDTSSNILLKFDLEESRRMYKILSKQLREKEEEIVLLRKESEVEKQLEKESPWDQSLHKKEDSPNKISSRHQSSSYQTFFYGYYFSCYKFGHKAVNCKTYYERK